MMKSNSILFRIILTVGLIGLYFGAVFGVWFVGERNAYHKTEELLNYAREDLSFCMELFFYGVLAIDGSAAKATLASSAPHSAAELRQAIRCGGLDELHVIGRDGRVLSSTEPNCVGLDILAIDGCEALAALTNVSVQSVNLPFRPSVAGGTEQVLYTGLPFGKGAFILCGYRESMLARHFARTGNGMLSSWHLGETGGFLVFGETNRLTFDANQFGGWHRGMSVARLGAAEVLELADDPETTHRGTICGMDCYYRHFFYLGQRVLAVVPRSEFYSSAMRTAVEVAILLLLVFIIFSVAFVRLLALGLSAKMRKVLESQHLTDMAMAKSIQLHALPSVFPPYPDHIEHFDIFASMQPAKEVGGDFYDFFFLDRNRIALVIADVAGKGVPAAMFMMRAKTTIHSQMNGGVSVAEAVNRANWSLCSGNTDNMFVTAWIGVCDLRTGEIEFINAGHNPPFVRRADGTFEWLRARSGLVLAASEDFAYKTKSVRLAPGDELFLYTDGLTEAQDAAGELYGENRLESAARGVPFELPDAHAFCRKVNTDLTSFVKGAEQADDITMLAFRLKSLVDVSGEPKGSAPAT